MLIKVKDPSGLNKWKLIDNVEEVTFAFGETILDNIMELDEFCDGSAVDEVHIIVDKDIGTLLENWHGYTDAEMDAGRPVSYGTEDIKKMTEWHFTGAYFSGMFYTKNNRKHLLVYDTEAYIMNDEGKTLEKV